MNTRQAIQPSNEPAVLSISLSESRHRFIAALATGLRVFRTDNCLTTYSPQLPKDGSVSIAEALDDRYIAFVGGGRAPAEKPSVVIFWDAALGKEVQRFEFHEAVLGVRLGRKWMVVVLKERTIVFGYQGLEAKALPTPPPESEDNEVGDAAEHENSKAPNTVKALYPTAPNIHALAVLRDDLLVLPSQTIGQLQLISLQPDGGKRVLPAHQSSIRCLAISDDGALLATASEQGTLIRVFALGTLDQIAEFRRGSDHAIILSLAFSPSGNRWLASTSDKGTLHIFDLRPPNAEEVAAAQEKRAREERQHRKSTSYAGHRLSGQGYNTMTTDKDSLSGFSAGRSSPTAASHPSAAITGPGTTAYQGSVQEYYGLRPPPASASPPAHGHGGAGVSLLAGLKSSPFAPRILKDIRSVATAPFYTGNDPPHWQGGPSHSWTTAPKGTRKRVRNVVAGLPRDPTGRPPKGILAFAPAAKGREDRGKGEGAKASDGGDADDRGAVLYVIGGGSDARWEMFELLPTESGGWVVLNRGFRRYLTRQFVD